MAKKRFLFLIDFGEIMPSPCIYFQRPGSVDTVYCSDDKQPVPSPAADCASNENVANMQNRLSSYSGPVEHKYMYKGQTQI